MVESFSQGQAESTEQASSPHQQPHESIVDGLQHLLISAPSPLPFVPFEILAKIFIASRDIILEDRRPSMAALLRVSQVCARWRDIAHFIAALWTHLFLNFHSKRRYTRVQKLVQSWIARSGTQALAVHVYSCYPRPHNPVIDFVLAHASRIRELSLRLPTAHFRPFLQAPPGTFPVLETVSMTVIPKSETMYDASWGESRDEFFGIDTGFAGEFDRGILWADMGHITVLQNTPSLRRLAIESSFTNLDSRTLPLAWGELTEIDFSFVTISVFDCAFMLPMCTGLVRLTFSTDSSNGPCMPQIPPVTIPNLQAVDWQGFHVDDLSIFSPLILPSLLSLKMREGDEESVLFLRSNSPFALRELELVFFTLSFPRFSKFLRDMPSLTKIELYQCITLTDELFAFLAYDARTPVLPWLARLVLCSGHQHFSEPCMVRMVASRWGATPLKYVRISARPVPAHASTPAVHRKVLDRIAVMAGEGLAFDYDYS
ncbi:hypothetical protein DFH09DRAFT_1074048 [Mycena vulgaris]|nr:hypothetical protein DFH09DRAFT_1074048 [Mycena vulgaris]